MHVIVILNTNAFCVLLLMIVYKVFGADCCKKIYSITIKIIGKKNKKNLTNYFIMTKSSLKIWNVESVTIPLSVNKIFFQENTFLCDISHLFYQY